MRLELVDVKGTVLVRRCKPEQLELVGVERLFRRSAGLISALCSGRPGTPLYLKLDPKDRLDQLSISGREACVTLTDLEFTGQLELRLQCILCSINLVNCQIDSLRLLSESQLCSVDLCDYTAQLDKLDADLRGTSVGGVRLVGSGHVQLRGRSGLCMLLAQSSTERVLEFRRDASSQVRVHLPSAEQRCVYGEYESWLVRDGQLTIGLSPPEDEHESSDTEPENCCSYCLRAEAVYRLEPCQHLCACESCFKSARQHCPAELSCPLCRGPVLSARILL